VLNDYEWQLQKLYNELIGTMGNQPLSTTKLSYSIKFAKNFEQRSHVESQKPVFKFIHLEPPHIPVKLDKECQYVEIGIDTRTSFKGQATCALKLAIRMINTLKTLGVYDNSIIVIQADHGSHQSLHLEEFSDKQASFPRPRGLPMLLVKKVNARGKLKVSDAPIILSDLAQTIASEFDLEETFPGRSIFDIEDNERRIRYYQTFITPWRSMGWEKILVQGHAWNAESWSPTGQLYIRKDSPKIDKVRTSEIDFGTTSGRKFLSYYGWGGDKKNKNKDTYVSLIGNVASVFVTFPDEENDVVMTLRAAHSETRTNQQLIIKLNGHVVTEFPITDTDHGGIFQEFVAVFPRKAIKRNMINVITFEISQVDSSSEQEQKSSVMRFERMVFSRYNTRSINK